MTFADLAAMKRVSDPQISPSGKWVLFSVTDVSLEKNTRINHLWAVPLDGHTKELQLTTGSGEANGRFSPDGKSVMYTADDQLTVAPWDEAAGRMGPAHAVTALETGADGGLWAPDSRHFLFVSSVYPECQSHAAMGPPRNEEEANCNALKDSVETSNPVKAQVLDHLLYRHWNAYVGPKHSHIFYASLDPGAGGKPAAPTDLTPASVVSDHEAPTFSLGGSLGYAISPDGKEVAYEVNLDKVSAESTNNDIFVLQVGAEPGTARKVSTSPGSDDGPQYSPDGKWLAWRSQARAGFESDKYRLLLFDRVSGATRDLTNRFDGWVDEFTWSPLSETLYFASASKGQEPIFLIKLDNSGVTELQATHYQDSSGTTGTPSATFGAEFSDLHISLNGRVLVANGMRAEAPAAIYQFALGAFDLKTQSQESALQRWRRSNGNDTSDATKTYAVPSTPIADPNVSLTEQLELAAMQPFWFASEDNTKVQGFLIRPPNFDPAKKYPLKFLIHGGPQGAWGDAWSYRWNPELLAANGYVVVMINPRGSTGYGQQFTDEVSGDWGGRAYQDLMRGLDFAEKTYPFIDKTRECALGASYGGYMANWVLTHTDRFKCIVTHDGMYNPQSAFGTTEELWFNEWEFRPMAPSAAKPTQIPSGDDDKKGNGSIGHAVVEQTRPSHPWDFYDKPASEDPFRKWSPMLAIKNAHTPTLVIHGQRDYRLDVSEGFQLFTALQLLKVPSKMLYFPDEGHWVLKPKNSELWYETVNDWCDRWTGTNKYASAGPEKNPGAGK